MRSRGSGGGTGSGVSSGDSLVCRSVAPPPPDALSFWRDWSLPSAERLNAAPGADAAPGGALGAVGAGGAGSLGAGSLNTRGELRSEVASSSSVDGARRARTHSVVIASARSIAVWMPPEVETWAPAITALR